MASAVTINLSLQFAKQPRDIITADDWNALMRTIDNAFNEMSNFVYNQGAMEYYRQQLTGPFSSGTTILGTTHNRGNIPIVKCFVVNTQGRLEEVYDSPIIDTTNGNVTVFCDQACTYVVYIW